MITQPMKTILISVLSLVMMGAWTSAVAQEVTEEEAAALDSMVQMQLMYQVFIDSFEKALVFHTDTIDLNDGMASLIVPEGYKYINGEQTSMLLQIWGNPESESLGMLLLESEDPMDSTSYVIELSYEEEGYVDDEDAADLDYDELLESMQADAAEGSKLRVEMGYESVELVGWASEPFYDAENKKLHWAQELKFGSSESHTLNYNIRILGRQGYLVMNVIAEMDQVENVKANADQFLESVTFNEGHQYDDFNPEIDKIAAVGIGGLIAGKVLAKAGLLAKLGVLLAKFWKLILLGGAGLLAGIKKFFGGKEEA
ncbi:DUF2167 domain-containing protein [Pontibacter sp. G13]|uniref:DUF2167 domain-containing protein n=1 Tax=Pontibacter sp. G13 TaxID=3074898 RepID=UPI00288C5108|nr:DUF2167 domain-containing protein [Pontibacter sp. G13]WNJ16089.1 DUF2167 domain-containing protein [Pontibacter sp. G13]